MKTEMMIAILFVMNIIALITAGLHYLATDNSDAIASVGIISIMSLPALLIGNWDVESELD